MLLTARVSWPWRQALVEREAQLEAAILQQPEVWQLLAQEAPAITGPGGGMWPSNQSADFPPNESNYGYSIYIYMLYVIIMGEKDDKLINHYCIVCRLCMMLHTHMWNKGKRAARVDVVRERESWRGETVWVIEFHLTCFVTNIFVGVVLHGFAGVTWKHKFSCPSVTAFYCTPRCFLVRCIMNWCKNNGKQNASLVCWGLIVVLVFSHSLKCGFHSQWDSRIQHW